MGILYIVGTPIGNLEDISPRALRVLQEVTLIATEDTRKARILLDHFRIHTPVTSYFEGNERQKAGQILGALDRGDVALISEAGMPAISDPGYPLVREAIAQGIPISVVPGPSAHTAALVLSGLPTDRFVFLGFLSRKTEERRSMVAEVAGVRATLVFYEAPHRLIATLKDLFEILGDRPVALCRELTKMYEEVWRGPLREAFVYLEEHSPRGEYTVVVGGAPAAVRWEAGAVQEALAERLAEGMSRSQAARDVAALSGWSRRDVYDLADPESPRPGDNQ